MKLEDSLILEEVSLILKWYYSGRLGKDFNPYKLNSLWEAVRKENDKFAIILRPIPTIFLCRVCLLLWDCEKTVVRKAVNCDNQFAVLTKNELRYTYIFHFLNLK